MYAFGAFSGSKFTITPVASAALVLVDADGVPWFSFSWVFGSFESGGGG